MQHLMKLTNVLPYYLSNILMLLQFVNICFKIQPKKRDIHVGLTPLLILFL